MHTHTPEDLLPPSWRMDSVSPTPSSSWTTVEIAQVLLDVVTPAGWMVPVGGVLCLTTNLPSAFS